MNAPIYFSLYIGSPAQKIYLSLHFVIVRNLLADVRMRAVYNAFSHIEGVINSGHDIWRFIFQGPKLADAQTCGPYAEYKSPSITLLNFITPSKEHEKNL